MIEDAWRASLDAGSMPSGAGGEQAQTLVGGNECRGPGHALDLAARTSRVYATTLIMLAPQLAPEQGWGSGIPS